MILAGSFHESPSLPLEDAPARKRGRHFCVRLNTLCTFRVKSLVKAESLETMSGMGQSVAYVTHRIAVNAITPSSSGIVDENVQHLFLLLEFGD